LGCCWLISCCHWLPLRNQINKCGIRHRFKATTPIGLWKPGRFLFRQIPARGFSRGRQRIFLLPLDALMRDEMRRKQVRVKPEWHLIKDQ
jgi:hypothetical protein